MVQTFPKPKIKTSINKLYLRGQEKAPAICFMLYLSVFLFFKTLFIKTHSSFKIFTDTGCVLVIFKSKCEVANMYFQSLGNWEH